MIDLLEPGDVVMAADKSFDIQDLLVPKRVILNIPFFLKEKDQLSLQEEAKTTHIASVKIFIERAIECVAFCSVLYLYPCSLQNELD